MWSLSYFQCACFLCIDVLCSINQIVLQVEDLTGKGLQDLEAGVIRTPLSPFVTFKDDPLRVLRAVRFSARLNFILEPDLRAAASSVEIVEALKTKVSRERVYKEVEGMMVGAGLRGGGRPYLAFLELYRLRLLDAVFPVSIMLLPFMDQMEAVHSSTFPTLRTTPGFSTSHAGWEEIGIKVARQLNLLLHLRCNFHCGPDASVLPLLHASDDILSIPPISGSLHVLHPSVLKALYFSATLVPLAGIIVGQGKRRGDFYLHVLREGVKMEGAGIKAVQTLVEAANRFYDVALRREPLTLDNAGIQLFTHH